MTTEQIREAIEKEFPGIVIRERKMSWKGPNVYLEADVPRKGLRHARTIGGSGGMKSALKQLAEQLDIKLEDVKG